MLYIKKKHKILSALYQTLLCFVFTLNANTKQTQLLGMILWYAMLWRSLRCKWQSQQHNRSHIKYYHHFTHNASMSAFEPSFAIDFIRVLKKSCTVKYTPREAIWQCARSHKQRKCTFSFHSLRQRPQYKVQVKCMLAELTHNHILAANKDRLLLSARAPCRRLLTTGVYSSFRRAPKWIKKNKHNTTQ